MLLRLKINTQKMQLRFTTVNILIRRNGLILPPVTDLDLKKKASN